MKLKEILDQQGRTLVEIKADLQEHMRRSKANEEAIGLMRTEIEPLKAHVSAWAGAGKLLAVLVAVAALLKAFGVL